MIRSYKGRLRQIFPSADRAKAIVEVRVSILDADAHVKPEMTASVTFQEPHARTTPTADRGGRRRRRSAPVVLVPKRAGGGSERSAHRLGRHAGTSRRTVSLTLGSDRIDQVEVRERPRAQARPSISESAGRSRGRRARPRQGSVGDGTDRTARRDEDVSSRRQRDFGARPRARSVWRKASISA
mgnify:CR=1 FL=1